MQNADGCLQNPFPTAHPGAAASCDRATAHQALQGAAAPQCQPGFPAQLLHFTTAPSTHPLLTEFPLQGCGFECWWWCILKHKLINFSLMRTLLAGDYYSSAEGDTNKHSQAGSPGNDPDPTDPTSPSPPGQTGHPTAIHLFPAIPRFPCPSPRAGNPTRLREGTLGSQQPHHTALFALIFNRVTRRGGCCWK